MSIAPVFVPTMLPAWKLRTAVTTAGPAVLTLAQIKAHLRLPPSFIADDAYLASLGAVAQQLAEEYCSRKFSTTQILGQADDSFSVNAWWAGVITAPASVLFSAQRGLEIPLPALQSVQSLTFVAYGGGASLIPASAYLVDASDPNRNGRLVLKYSTSIGGLPQEILSIQVAYTCGYVGCPVAIVQALLLLTAYLYDNRGACGDAVAGPIVSSGAAAILGFYRVLRV